MDVEIKRPVLVQASGAPLFRGCGDQQLACECGQLLVEGYEPRSLIALDLECYSCKAITPTPAWPSGEPLPIKLDSLGGADRINVATTVDLPEWQAISYDQEIARANLEAGIRSPGGTFDLNLSADGLASIVAALDDLTGGGLSKKLERTRRELRRGNDYVKYPLAWAVARLEQQVAAGKLDMGGADGIALVYVKLAWQLLGRWTTHSLYRVMAKGIVHEFHHTLAMLLAEDYLACCGNPIGFTEVNAGAGRSPDLFVNITHSRRASIEVKAPTQLQWPATLGSSDTLQDAILNQLNRARDQITGGFGGVVFLGSSSLSPDSRGLLETAVRSLAERGRVSRQIACVAGVCIHPFPTFSPAGFDTFTVNSSAEVFLVRNPRFEGGDILTIVDPPAP